MCCDKYRHTTNSVPPFWFPKTRNKKKGGHGMDKREVLSQKYPFILSLCSAGPHSFYRFCISVIIICYLWSQSLSSPSFCDGVMDCPKVSPLACYHFLCDRHSRLSQYANFFLTLIYFRHAIIRLGIWKWFIYFFHFTHSNLDLQKSTNKPWQPSLKSRKTLSPTF